MKKILVVAAAALMMAGCNRDNTANESAGAQKDAVKANADAQKDALNAQKDAISKQASQQKDQIEAQAKASKEQINAQKDEIDAQAKAAKAQADAQAKAANANEAAGASTTADAGNSDSLIKAKVRAAILGNSADSNNPASVSANPNAPKDLNVDVSSGKVTLKGSVASDQAKMDCEQRAKQVAGVTSVDNQLEIKAQ
jgi:osmotically-inducible protein OsmY